MVENSTNIIEGSLAQVGVAIGIIENVDAIFYQELMEVHSAARRAKVRFGHEGYGFPFRECQVFCQIFDHQ